METKRYIEVINGVAMNECTASVATDAGGVVVDDRPHMIEVPLSDGIDYLGRPYNAKTGTFGDKPVPVEAPPSLLEQMAADLAAIRAKLGG